MQYSQRQFPLSAFTDRHFATIVVALIIFFSSCKPALKFATVRYDRDAVNRLLDSTKMQRLVFQFATDNSGSYKNPFTLIAYAYDSANNLIDKVPYSLREVERSKPLSFSGNTFLGNLVVWRQEILAVVTDSTNQRTKFDFLMFVPERDKELGYLLYDMSAATQMSMNGRPRPKRRIRPCPPAINCQAPPTP